MSHAEECEWRERNLPGAIGTHDDRPVHPWITREYVQTYMEDMMMHETHWPKGSLLTCMEKERLITTKMPPEPPPDGTHYLDIDDSTDPAAKHEKLLEYIIIVFR